MEVPVAQALWLTNESDEAQRQLDAWRKDQERVSELANKTCQGLLAHLAAEEELLQEAAERRRCGARISLLKGDAAQRAAAQLATEWRLQDQGARLEICEARNGQLETEAAQARAHHAGQTAAAQADLL